MEKPKLDNARKLTGIYFIDPEDREYEKTRKNARKKLEVPMEAAMACEMETRKPQETVASESTDSHKKTKYACNVEAHESTRKRLESALPRNHEDHIAEKKGFIQQITTTWCAKFSMLQAVKILDAKASVDKEWEKLEQLPAWQLAKVRSKKEVVLEAQTLKKNSPCCYFDGHCASQKCGVSKKQRTSRAPR